MLASSDKLLSITTQLIDPSKLRTFSAILSSQGQIANIANLPATLSFNKQKVLTTIGDQIISLGKIEDFTVQATDPVSTMESLSCTDPQCTEVTGNGTDVVIQHLYNSNTLTYIPVPTDSIVTINTLQSNKIIINDDIAINLDQGVIKPFIHIELSDQRWQEHNIWNIYWYNKLVGRIILHRADNIIIDTRGK